MILSINTNPMISYKIVITIKSGSKNILNFFVAEKRIYQIGSTNWLYFNIFGVIQWNLKQQMFLDSFSLFYLPLLFWLIYLFISFVDLFVYFHTWNEIILKIVKIEFLLIRVTPKKNCINWTSIFSYKNDWPIRLKISNSKNSPLALKHIQISIKIFSILKIESLIKNRQKKIHKTIVLLNYHLSNRTHHSRIANFPGEELSNVNQSRLSLFCHSKHNPQQHIACSVCKLRHLSSYINQIHKF